MLDSIIHKKLKHFSCIKGCVCIFFQQHWINEYGIYSQKHRAQCSSTASNRKQQLFATYSHVSRGIISFWFKNNSAVLKKQQTHRQCIEILNALVTCMKNRRKTFRMSITGSQLRFTFSSNNVSYLLCRYTRCAVRSFAILLVACAKCLTKWLHESAKFEYIKRFAHCSLSTMCLKALRVIPDWIRSHRVINSRALRSAGQVITHRVHARTCLIKQTFDA